MRVLVACEFSGVVREAFLAKGHDAYSCDVLPSRHHAAAKGRHIQGDVRPLLKEPWDLVIAHPPCTYLTNCGVRWFKDDPVGRKLQLLEGAKFFVECLNANAPRVCVENPIMHKYARELIETSYSQIIQPFEYGHNDSKATCIWLKGLPLLKPTKEMEGRYGRCHMIRHRHQALLRSITYSGIAAAMAEQWG